MSNEKYQILIETDMRHGKGYQLHEIRGAVNKIIGFDEGVMASLDQAMDYAIHLLDKYSKETGNRPSPLEAIIIDDKVLEENADRDVRARQLLRDGDLKELPDFEPTEETAGAIIRMLASVEQGGVGKDGVRQMRLSIQPLGLFLVMYETTKEFEETWFEPALKAFCRFLASHGYGKGEEEIWEELQGMTRPQGVHWLFNNATLYNLSEQDIKYFCCLAEEEKERQEGSSGEDEGFSLIPGTGTGGGFGRGPGDVSFTVHPGKKKGGKKRPRGRRK